MIKVCKSPEYIEFLNNKSFNEHGLYDSIFYSKSYGKFKVTKCLGKNKKFENIYEIKFINTGYIGQSRKQRILRGEVMDPIYDNDVIIGSIYKSNNYGNFVIEEFAGRTKEDSRKLFKIKFIDTGYETIAVKNNILTGNVKDAISFNSLSDDIVGETFHSDSGDFIINKCNGTNKHGVKIYQLTFINTNYTISTTKGHIKNGEVYDPLNPVIYNIGYLGENYNNLRQKDRDLYTTMYSRWCGMIRRCYDTSSKAYSAYGLIGVKVDKRWYDFCNFYNDIISLENFCRERDLYQEN